MLIKLGQPSPMVVPTGSPRKVNVVGGIICRYGFEEIPGSGYSKCVEQLFASMPSCDELRAIIEDYNFQNQIDDPFIPSDYGF